MVINLFSITSQTTIIRYQMQRSLEVMLHPLLNNNAQIKFIPISIVNLRISKVSMLLWKYINRIMIGSKVLKTNQVWNTASKAHLILTVVLKCKAIQRYLGQLYQPLSFKLQILRLRLIELSWTWVIALRKLRLTAKIKIQTYWL